MSVGEALVFNIIAILALAFVVGYIAPRGDRAQFGAATGWILLILSFWGWVIYVAVHFISKYW